MSRSPFEALGVGERATEAELRAAFRRLALELHPDRNPSDPGAEERFKRMVIAYERALAVARGLLPDPSRPAAGAAAPPPRRRFRWTCACCDDSYALPDRCPRCELPLHDSWSGPSPEVAPDPRVDRLIERLERRAALREPRGPAVAPWLPSLGALCFLGAGGFVLSLGALPVAFMLAAFGASVGALELHTRLRPRPAYAI